MTSKSSTDSLLKSQKNNKNHKPTLRQYSSKPTSRGKLIISTPSSELNIKISESNLKPGKELSNSDIVSSIKKQYTNLQLKQWKKILEKESQIESMNIESNYSKEALDLLAKENRFATQAMYKSYQTVSKAVDIQLKKENDKYYCDRSTKTCKEWRNLFENLHTERRSFLNLIGKQIQSSFTEKINSISSAATVSFNSSTLPLTIDNNSLSHLQNTSSPSFSISQFKDVLSLFNTPLENSFKKLPLECDSLSCIDTYLNNLKDNSEYSPETMHQMDALHSIHMDRLLYLESIRNWSCSERSNIQRALDIQLAKLEVDWSCHEDKLREEYKEEIKHLELKYNISFPSHEETSFKKISKMDSSNTDIQWKDSIQQSNLIHTAPSLTPSMFVVGSSKSEDFSNADISISCMKKITKLPNHVQIERLHPLVFKEFRAIETFYEGHFKTLKFQKEMAKKWIYRQHCRINSHLNFVEKEKKIIEKGMEQLYQDSDTIEWILSKACNLITSF